MKICIIGVGYVGLSSALLFSQKHEVVAYDIDERRVEELRQQRDRNGDIPSEALLGCEEIFTSNPNDLGSATFYVVTVPTPIDKNRRLRFRACLVLLPCPVRGPQSYLPDHPLFDDGLAPLKYHE